MTVPILIVSFSSAFIAIGGAYVLIRSELVFRYRSYLLKRVGYASRRDIYAQPLAYDWLKRFEAFEAVPYKDMVFSFKPIDSFYPDKWFIDPNEHR